MESYRVSLYVYVVVIISAALSALAIQCYRCPHDLCQIMGLMQNPAALNNLCSNPETIDCSQDANIGQFADACFTSVISLNTSMFGEIKFTQMNCNVKSFCGQAKNVTCELIKPVFQGLPGFEMTDCDYTCCEGDLCNKPSKGSTTKSVAPTTSPSPTTPPSSTNKTTAISQADVSDHSNPLMSLLRHFNENRHHVTNPQGKQRARDFIKKTFQDLGLKTWSEEFQPDHPQFASGYNIVGMIPGTLAGSPNDRLFVIGAHYDTVRTTSSGADDNGSGVVALLQVAKQIVADFKTCSRAFSILFVAFDFEEWEDCSNKALYPKCACGHIDCGSRAYVANLTRFYNGSLSSNGNIQGAIIMDTVMNYNSTPYSQVLPGATSQLLPELYNQIKKDEFRGDFLSVTGRQVDDRTLIDLFWYHYNQVESDLKDKTTMYSVKLPFQGQPSKLSDYAYHVMSDFLRSDHVSFWESIPSLSAIFLSDTANLRGHMTSCYHEDCDRLSRVTPRMLQFLQKTIDVILSLTNDVTKMSCPQRILKFTNSADVSEDGMAAWGVALLAIGMILIGVLIGVVAAVFYQRWKKQQGPLVTTHDLPMQSNTNPAT